MREPDPPADADRRPPEPLDARQFALDEERVVAPPGDSPVTPEDQAASHHALPRMPGGRSDSPMAPDDQAASWADGEGPPLEDGAGGAETASLGGEDGAASAAVAAARGPAPWRSWVRGAGGWLARFPGGWPLVAILSVAAVLRVFGYDWDEGTQLHPDERAIGNALAGIGLPHSWAEFWSPASPLNPHFSAYGHLPFYATVLFANFLSWWGHTVGGPLAGLTYATSSSGAIESGRVLSGLADTGALFFVFLIGRHVFGRSVGLLAALLGCFTVLDLEFSHMAGVDTYLGFFATGALYYCVRIVRYGRPRDYLWAGTWIGCAIACKISGAPLLVPLIVAHAYRGSEPLAPEAIAAGAHARRRALPANPLLLVMALAAGVVAVFVTMPYAFIDFTNWWGQVWGQLQLAQGITEAPYTRKFSGLPNYWYPLQQLLGWTMGLPLGVTVAAGVGRAIWRQVRRRRGSELVLLAWVVIFFGATAGQYMKFLRYMVPLVPALDLFAAALLVAVWRWARAGGAGRRPIGVLARVAVGAIVLLTVLYGLAYDNIYTTENTRIAATRWMAAHIPAGSAIMHEGGWDEVVPWAAPGLTVPPFQSVSVDILGPTDDAGKVQGFVQALQTAQYIAISSARIYGSVAHQPGRYPYSIRWYDLLFGGKLNFRLEKAFANHPHLGPFVVDDYQSVPQADAYTRVHLWYEADQNMSEYDHPPVFIFKRTGNIDPAQATALLTDNGRLAPTVAAYDPSHSMLLPPAVERADRAAPTYDEIFPPDNPLARVPLLSWLVMVELVGLLALPLVMRACGGLRDGGYALAKMCGILVVGYLTWLAASLHAATYSRALILGSCLVVLLLSLAVGPRPRALWRELRARRRGILWAEAVFLGGFLALVAARMAYPDLWHYWYGGERTQEVSFMNAILRSQYFPPLDPWFAGGTLNYYYYGQYLTGMLMKLVGIPVPIGFNLALPTLYGLLLSIAFSIGYNATGRVWVGGAALALEGVLGNLGPLQQFAALSPSHGLVSSVPVIGGLRDALGGLFAVLTHQNGLSLPGDFFWTSSRILNSPGDSVINEFPIWSFTYGDMHAHVVDMPVLLCGIALALAVSGLGGGDRGAGGRPGVRSVAPPRGVALLLLGGLIAVVAGATGPINLWDLPTSIIVAVAGFALRGYFAVGRRGWALVVRDMVVPGGVLGLLCLVLYRPFYASVLGISSGFTFLLPHLDTGRYLLHLGLPLFVLTSFFVVFVARQTRPLYWMQRVRTLEDFSAYYGDQAERLPRLFRAAGAMMRAGRPAAAPPALLSWHVLIVGLLVTIGVLEMGFQTMGLIAAVLTLGTIALVEACARWRLNHQESQPFALVLAVMGLSLTALPDFVMQNEAGRMNTFFKLYNQAWPLLALAAALALSALVPPRRRPAAVAAGLLLATEPIPGAMPAAAMASVSAPRDPSPMTEGRDRTSARDAGLLPAAGLVPATAPAGAARELPMTTQRLSARVTDEAAEGRGEAQATPRPDGEEGGVEGGEHAPDDGVPAAQAGAPAGPGRPAAAGAGRAGFGEWRVLWWAVLAVLVFGAALFPIFGTYSHLQLRSGWSQTASANIPTGLDGAAFMRVLYPADTAAIDWINGHLHGTPVLLTSGRGGYRDFAAKVTMFTGLPTVAEGGSWGGEDAQERYAGQGRPQSQFPSQWVNQFDSGRVTWNGGAWAMNLPTGPSFAPGSRASDVETIYNTPDFGQALALLHEYHVSYIYVGTAERGDPSSDEAGQPSNGGKPGFTPTGLAKFDRMVAAGQLSVVYHSPGVAIYQVKG